MKIWLSRTLLARYFGQRDDYAYQENMSMCPADEPCPRDEGGDRLSFQLSSHSVPPSLFLSEEDLSPLRRHTFVSSQQLHIQTLLNGRWLVCNPIDSGALAVLDTEAYALLSRFRTPQTLQESTQGDPASLQAVALLVGLGFVRDLDEPAAPPRQESQTLSAWMHVTNQCNLRCSYCYVHKTSEHMADDTSKRAVDGLLRSVASYGYRGLHLTYAGGEATLRLPQVIAVHDYALEQTRARGLHFSATLLSNGVFLSSNALEQIKERQITVGISLDGVGEFHDQQRPFLNGRGSFKLVDRTIAQMLKVGLIPSINVVVTQRNLDELPRLLEYILQRELPFGLSYYRENECSSHLTNLQCTDAQMIAGMLAAFAYIEEHLPRKPLLGGLVNKASMGAPRQYACGVGRHYLAIDQRGGIARCHADIGDIVTTIDAENPLQAVRSMTRGVQAVAIEEKEGCRSCEWRHWCTGGCPLLTYRMTGRSDIKSPDCAIYKALFPEALRLEGLRLLTYEEPLAFDALVTL